MTRDEVIALLRGLGDTPEAVARTLLAWGVKGCPGHPFECPIAHLLKAHGVNPRVDTDRIEIDADDGPVIVSYAGRLPAISSFVAYFDGQHTEDECEHAALYAELVERPTEASP